MDIREYPTRENVIHPRLPADAVTQRRTCVSQETKNRIDDFDREIMYLDWGFKSGLWRDPMSIQTLRLVA